MGEGTGTHAQAVNEGGVKNTDHGLVVWWCKSCLPTRDHSAMTAHCRQNNCCCCCPLLAQDPSSHHLPASATAAAVTAALACRVSAVSFPSTCEHDWVLRQCCSHCLGQQRCHGHAVGLEALVQGIKLVSLNAHAHTELRNLWWQLIGGGVRAAGEWRNSCISNIVHFRSNTLDCCLRLGADWCVIQGCVRGS